MENTMDPVKDPSHLYEVERRARLVTNAGDCSANFLILQGIGEYDYVPPV